MSVTAAFYVLLASSMTMSAELRNDFSHPVNDDNFYLANSDSCRDRCRETVSHGSVTVNCTGAECTRVPYGLRSDTTSLILVFNKIKRIGKNAFHSLVNLIYLDLSRGEIQTLRSGCFEPLRKLAFLNLSFNPGITRFPDGIFNPLRNLRYLNLKRTQQSCEFNQRPFSKLASLKTLTFSWNNLISFPDFHDAGKNRSLLPNLKKLSLRRNSIGQIVGANLRGLENSLESLNLRDNKIFRISSDAFKDLRKLRQLLLDRNQLVVVRCNAFRSRSLEYLSLAFSDFRFRAGSPCNKDFLRRVPNLKVLILAHSSGLRFISSPFTSNKGLVRLNLMNTLVNRTYLKVLTKTLPNLRSINLYKNQIMSLGVDLWNDLELEELNLGKNMITTINVTSLSQKLWKSLKNVDFSGNPFYCDCNLVWFRQWLRENRATVTGSERTLCSGPPERSYQKIVETVRPTPLECFAADRDWFLLTVFLLCLTIVSAAAVISISHKFRWYIKYWYFKTKNKARRLHEFLDETEYEFDAFVSYSESDSRWVVDTLCQVLENQYNLRLCVHHRDWMIGCDIVTNIIDSIEKSRKTLMIVSNAFAGSQWCHFEMTMAQTKLFEDDRENLVLVLLEEIADCNMNPRLQLQMQRKTYVEWTKSPVGQQLFWEKLRQTISTGSSSIVNSVPPQELFVSGEET